jgi:hypothetical protein
MNEANPATANAVCAISVHTGNYLLLQTLCAHFLVYITSQMVMKKTLVTEDTLKKNVIPQQAQGSSFDLQRGLQLRK